MTKLRLAVVDGSDAGIRLDQFCQIAHVPHEAKGKFLCGPDAPISPGLELFVEPVQLQCRLLEISEVHVMPPKAAMIGCNWRS